jgi:hypothetical protein
MISGSYKQTEVSSLDTPMPTAPNRLIDAPRKSDLERKIDAADRIIQKLLLKDEKTHAKIRDVYLSCCGEFENPDMLITVSKHNAKIQLLCNKREKLLN